MAERYKCYYMETRPAYTLNLAEKIGFNINSVYIYIYVSLYICMYVRTHVGMCVCVYVRIYIQA